MSTDRPQEDLTSFITYRLVRLQSRLNAQAIRILRRDSDLALTEWRVLALVARHGKTTLSAIAGQTDLDKGQLSRSCTSLQKKGYLMSSVNNTDQRQNLLALTDSGRAIHARILPVMGRRQDVLTAELTATEEAVLSSVIEKLERASQQDP